MTVPDRTDVGHGRDVPVDAVAPDALLNGLPADVARPVPACPGWDVHDVVAHLVGVVEDALAGRLSGPPAPEQTAAQVARSRQTSLAELLDTWAAIADDFEAVVGELQIWPAAVDVVTHDLDVRAAIGHRGGRDAPEVRTVAEQLVADRRTVPPLCFDLGDVELVTVGGAPEHRVRTSAFEITRICLGRRSVAQVLAMDWSPPVPAAPDGLFVFGPRPSALCE